MDTLVNDVRLISMIAQHSLAEMMQHVLIKLVVIPVNVPETLAGKRAKIVSNIDVSGQNNFSRLISRQGAPTKVTKTIVTYRCPNRRISYFRASSCQNFSGVDAPGPS